MKINNYLLETIVFVCGAVVMIFELVGSRILGPYFGTSIFIWTSLIGIILGSLSLGYFWGGKLADQKPSFKILSLIIFLSAVFIGLTTTVKDPLLALLQIKLTDIRIASICASLILFLPASVLLGMVSPYAAKLKLNNLNVSGATIGNLYAISTAGSIIGTFLSGFFLIPYFGTNKLLIILTIALALSSFALATKQLLKEKLILMVILIVSWKTTGLFNTSFSQNGFIDVDTSYNRIWIRDYHNQKNKQTVRVFSINNESSSAMFLDSDELVYEYTKYYHLAKHFNPNFKKSLMLGGAGYSFPKNFLIRYPEATIDVVEIDPMVTKLAKKYFKLSDDPRLTTYNEDGRVFLNKTANKYDVIFGDAFSSHYSIPYQLTTRETVQKKYDILNDGGAVILNLISSIEGKKGQFLRAEYATYQSVFPQVYLFPVSQHGNGNTVQNIALVALKTTKKPMFNSTDKKINEFLSHLWTKPVATDMPILTDDFAPVDYYINKTI